MLACAIEVGSKLAARAGRTHWLHMKADECTILCDLVRGRALSAAPAPAAALAAAAPLLMPLLLLPQHVGNANHTSRRRAEHAHFASSEGSARAAAKEE